MSFYKILSDDQNNFYATDWVSSIYKKSEGGELKVGASKHFYKGKRRLSLGGAISYRQQTMANVVLDGMQDKYRPDDGIYNISQTKRGTGLFLKFNFQFQRHRSCFEFFVYSRHLCNVYQKQISFLDPQVCATCIGHNNRSK